MLDGAGRLLLVKESYDRRRWAFPGGAVDPGESPLDSVVRELREETGEIAEVAWFSVGELPAPVTNVLHHALQDIASGARGVVRDGLPRIN